MINKENREKIFLMIIEYGTYLAMFTPLVFFRQYFFPFVVPKSIFFRIVVDIIFIAYILLIMSNRKYLPKISNLTISILVFLGIVIATSLLGVNPEKSFWSVFERMTGILTFFHLFAFYIVLSSVFKERKKWERILTVSMIVGVFICFYVWTTDSTFARGGGTLGNTSFLAGYLLFDIFFAIILLITKNGAWRILYGILLFILILGLFVSQEPCRGAIGSFFIGLFILGLVYLLFYLFSSNKQSLGFFVIFLIILAPFILFQIDFIRTEITGLWNSLWSRLMIWQMSYDGWKERFWIGWGQENFNIPFAKYFNPTLPLTFDVWYDRAHNIILDTAVASGALGLISYLAIFVTAGISLLRLFPKVINKRYVFFPLGMIVVLIAYFIQNIFVFDMISSYMMFFLSLAFINFLILANKEEAKQDYQKNTNPVLSFIGVILIIASILTIYFGNILPAKASNLIVRGISLPLNQPVPGFEKGYTLNNAVSDFETAYNISPISKTELPEQFSRRIVEIGSQVGETSSQSDREILNKGFNLAEEISKKSIEENPLDFRFRLFLGEYYRNLYQITKKQEYISRSEETLNAAMKLSPKNQQAYWGLGQTLLYEGKNDAAIENFKKAIDLEPRLPQSHWYLFLIYKSQEKFDLALEAFKKADELKYNWKGDAQSMSQVIDLYRRLNDFQSFLTTVEEGVKLFPDNVDMWINMADVYSATGQKGKAKEAADQILKLNPSLKPDIEKFLKDLGI